MAFELEGCEDIAEEVTHVAISELKSALALLNDTSGNVDTRVHETRKHMKKLRALLQLVRPHLRRTTFERLNDTLRDIASRIAFARDSAAQLETWDAVLEASDALAEPARKAVREKLVELRDRAASGEELEQAIRKACAEIQTVLDAVDDFRPAENGWKALGPGFRRTYGRGRRALEDVQKHYSDEALHGFRRFVKQHQYQVQLLEPAWPNVLHAHRGAVSDLGEMLGRHHDLCVIEHTLKVHPVGLDAALMTLVNDATQERKAELERKAFALAARIYAESPRRLEHRFKGYFEQWQKGQHAAAESKIENRGVSQPST